MTPLALPPRRTALALALGALGSAALALLPGELGPTAARAGLAATGVGAVALLARRPRRVAAAQALRVSARAGLSRAGGVAVVEVDGRRLLVGFGERAVELLCELDPAGAERP